MAKSIQLSSNSWQQPFKDRRKTVDAWVTNPQVAANCNIKDQTKRLLEVRFEPQFDLVILDWFTISSGKEILFPASLQETAKPIVFDHPESFVIFTVIDTVIDTGKDVMPSKGLEYSAPNTVSLAMVEVRIGQQKFRKQLIDYWQKCAVSGITEERLLRASHIKPWAVSDPNERLDPFNGILLNPLLDALFDKGYISFADDGEMLMASNHTQLIKKLGIDRNLKISGISREHTKYLAYHRENIFERNSK